MYINTFKYTPKDVSCQLCTEYVKKLGCTALRCPWLAERIEAGVVGYREAVMETFPRDRRLSSRLNLLIKHYPGSLWSNEQHERRMQYQCAVQGYHCRHSEADVESRCHKMRLNAAELEQAVFLTLKKQMEAAAPLAPDGTLRVDASVPERTEYEQQIEALQDGKRALYERYLMGEIDLNTYKAEKAACDELLLKTKNAYAAVLAQAKQKQDEQARQDSRKEASKAIFDADTLTTELAELLIDRVLVYPDKHMEIAYKIRDIFD